MQDKANQIILKLTENLLKVKTDQKVGKIIKDLDHVVQDAYIELFLLVEGRPREVNKPSDEKSGHCC